MDRRLIDHFVSAKLVSRQDMQRIILRASKDKRTLVGQMLDDGVDEVSLAAELARFHNVDVADLERVPIDPRALTALPPKLASKGGAFPFAMDELQDQLMVALYDPDGAAEVLKLLEQSTGTAPKIALAPRTVVMDAVAHYYFNQPRERFTRRNNQTQTQWGRSTTKGGVGEVRSGRVNLPSGRSGSGPLTRSNGGSNRSDFDDFLNDALEDGPDFDPGSMVDPNLGGLQVNTNATFWGEPRDDPRFNWEEQTRAARANIAQMPPHDVSGGSEGFDLFEASAPERVHEMTIQDMMQAHEDRIAKLKEEAKAQREVISVLVDMLVEARVISKREIKGRLKEIRRRR